MVAVSEGFDERVRNRRGPRLFLFAIVVALLLLAGAGHALADSPTSPVILQVTVQVGTGAGAPGAATIVADAAGVGSTCTDACSLRVAPGAKVALGVRTAVGYAFDHWSDTGVCSAPKSPTCSFVMPHAGAQLAAVIQPRTSTLTVVPGSAGTITGSQGGIACARGPDGSLTGSCAAVFPTGTTVRLSVKPAAGKHFVRWSIWQCGARRSCDVPLESDTTVAALISPVRLAVARSGSGGAITSTPSRLDCTAPCQQATAYFSVGTSVSLTADSTGNSLFSGWGAPCAGPIPACSLSLFADTTVSAAFGQLGAPTVGSPTYAASPTGLLLAAHGCGTSGYGSYSFSITVTQGGIVFFTAPGTCVPTRCSPTCTKGGYTQFDHVQVTAHAHRGWSFARWANGCQRGSSCSLPVFGHTWVRAVFRRVRGRRR